MDRTAIVRKRLEGVEPLNVSELGLDVYLLEPGALHYLDFNAVIEELRADPDQKVIKLKDLSPPEQKRWMQAMADLIAKCAYTADGQLAFDSSAMEVLPPGTLERLVNAVPFGQSQRGPD